MDVWMDGWMELLPLCLLVLVILVRVTGLIAILAHSGSPSRPAGLHRSLTEATGVRLPASQASLVFWQTPARLKLWSRWYWYWYWYGRVWFHPDGESTSVRVLSENGQAGGQAGRQICVVTWPAAGPSFSHKEWMQG